MKQLRETDYETIFRHRGDSYHKAMVDFPGIRRKEFENLFAKVPLQEGETLIDCPALGGYLSDNISTHIKVESLDFCPQSSKVRKLNEFNTAEKVDRVVCLASSHHINHLGNFLSQLTPFLRNGGSLHLADVNYNSSIRHFLDNFVGKWTSTGHKGIWRNLRDTPYEIEEGLFLRDVEVRKCPWIFSSEEEMLRFCRLLFGLDLNPSDQEIVDALNKYVGLSYSASECKVLWELTYVDFVKYD